MEYAYEGDHLSGEGQPSFFTEAVVEALETGKADRDQDHRISVQELYDYVYDCVTERSPAQTPHMKSELQGPLYVARSMYTAPARLHDDLVALVEHPIAGARLGAVQELAALLGSSDPATALAARQTLQRLVDDDSGKVSRAASAALADGGKPAAAAPGEVITGSEHEAPSSRRAAAPTKRDTARSEPAPESQPPISMQAGKGVAPPAEPALTERAPHLQVPPGRSRGRFGALLASGLAVAALAAGGVVLATSGDNPGPDPPVGGDGSARGPTGSGKGSGTESGSSATSEGLSTWPASLSAYTVVLASATNRADAEAVAERAPARSPSGVLRSDNYASLRPGYWVAFSGQYTTADEAERAADRLRGQGFAGAYARHVSDEEP